MRKKHSFYAFLIFFILIFTLAGLHSSYIEARMINNIDKEISIDNALNLTEIVFVSKPSFEGRIYYGDPNAPIVLLAYMDFNSEKSKEFISDFLPKIKDNYIHTGKIRYYPKYLLTTKDYRVKNERFIYAQSLECIGMLNKGAYFDFYYALFNTSPKGIIQLSEKFNVSKKEFIECVNKQEFENIKRDSIEVEKFNLMSFNPVFYTGIERPTKIIVGIPSFERFRRAILNFQTEIGD